MAGEPAEPPRRNLHGRQRGHGLRHGQRELLSRYLPELQITLPSGSEQYLDLAALFSGQPNEVWLEIGFGAGEHLSAQAEAHPQHGIIGCEPYRNGVARFIADWQRRGLENVRLFPDDARLLLAALPASSIDRIFILFPDPWPKRRHHKRRIIGPDTIGQLARVLRAGGELRTATDHSGFCRWALFHILAGGLFNWCARGASDWRNRPAGWPATRYENKAISQGRNPIFLKFERAPY